MHFRTGLAPKPNLGGIFCPPHLSTRQPGLKSPSQVQGARSHASGKPRDAVSPRRGGDPRPPAMLQAFARLLATPRATLRPPCVRRPPAYSIARPPVRRRTAPSFRWMQEPVSRFAQLKKSRLVQTAFVHVVRSICFRRYRSNPYKHWVNSDSLDSDSSPAPPAARTCAALCACPCPRPRLSRTPRLHLSSNSFSPLTLTHVNSEAQLWRRKKIGGNFLAEIWIIPYQNLARKICGFLLATNV